MLCFDDGFCEPGSEEVLVMKALTEVGCNFHHVGFDIQ
jgi:hypothetical protein